MKTILLYAASILLLVCSLQSLLAADGNRKHNHRSAVRLSRQEASNQPLGITADLPLVNLGEDRTICSNSVIKLDAGNPGAQYLWSTGEVSQTILVDYAGDFWVKVTNVNGSARDTVTIKVIPALAPDYKWQASGTCLPQAVSFTDMSASCGVEIQSWAWDFGDGSSSTERNPVHNFTTNGRYTVRLRIRDNLGNYTAKNKLVNIAANASPQVNLGADMDICEGTAVSLDAGNGGSNYSWSTGETSQQIHPTASGVYAVDVTSNGCTGHDEIVLHFKPGGTADFTAEQRAGDCESREVQFADKTTLCSAGATDWQWDFGDGQSGSGANTTHVFQKNGKYHIILQVTDATGKTYTAEKDISVSKRSPEINLGNKITECTDNPVLLNAGAFAGATYSWNTGETSSEIRVRTSGSYKVTVAANGCSAEAVVKVSFGKELDTDFSWDVLSACVPATLSFKRPISICGEFALPLWEFGDGSSAISERPSHTYSSSGNYEVRITLYKSNGTVYAVRTKTVTITGSTATVDLGPDQTICTGTAAILDAKNAGATYTWSTGATTQTIAATSPGDYIVTVNNNGCVLADTVTVALVPAFSEEFTYSIPEKTCLPVAVQFTDQSTACSAISTWHWDFGDGTSSTLQNAAHQYAADGHYMVTLTIADDLGNSTKLQKDIVVTSRNPVVNLGQDIVGFEGKKISLAANQPADKYYWSTGETSAQIEVATAGNYWLELTKDGCSARDTIRVSLEAPMDVQQQHIIKGRCLPVRVSFQDQTKLLDLAAPVLSRLWNFGDGNTSTETNPHHWYNKEGTYQVSLAVTNTNGLTIQSVQAVTIENTPPVLQLPADTSVCAGTSFQFAAQDPLANYLWSAPVATVQQHYNQPSIFIEDDIDLTVSASMCTVTAEKTIKIRAMHVPTPVISEAEGQLLSTGAHGLAYQWLQNDQVISNATDNVFKPVGAGSFAVVASNTAGCTAKSANYFYLPAGGFTIADSLRVKLAPNPSDGNFTIFVAGLPSKPVDIRIVNALGVAVYAGRIINNTTAVHLSGVRTGTYYALLSIDGQHLTLPFIIN
ncbi:MAG TPA: PKD domain-containing protein [Chitinophagaceae bacterium]|nr:PKD domain-containing protein [Chitinophagaceae bacterium]